MRARSFVGGLTVMVGTAWMVTACGTSDLDDGASFGGVDGSAFDAKVDVGNPESGTRDGAVTDAARPDATPADASIDGSDPDATVTDGGMVDAAPDTGVDAGDPCAIVDCGAHGVCEPVRLTCNCTDGYTGPQCEFPPPPATKTVFVTNARFRGREIGGLAGADAACQTAATAAKLTGVYKAWLSDSASSPATRFAPHPGPYARVDKVVVANGWNDLVDGTLIAGIDVTELGAKAPAGARAWTGTSESGAAIAATPADVCQDWTGASPVGAVLGTVGNVDATWSSDGTVRCVNQHRLYCFEQ